MLHDKLQKIHTYPFHMPGHKRNPKFDIPGAETDITEIEGFDNLHRPTGCIAALEKELAALYRAEASFLSVGGSTLGMLCAIHAVCAPGDTVIVARNCHKSVYNACFLRQLKVVYAEPSFDEENGFYKSLSQETVNALLKAYPQAKALILTSPTYEGFLSEVQVDIPLIIDAAHGAHLFDSHFPAYPQGSIVVSSLHKTLPALTGTAVIHVYESVYAAQVRFWLGIFETSSPSYVLMNSVSRCLEIIRNHPTYFDAFYRSLSAFRTIELQHMCLEKNDDISKLIISLKNTRMSGVELAEILRNEYSIEPEMASERYVILMTSIGDEPAAFEHLKNALEQIDALLTPMHRAPLTPPPVPSGLTQITRADKAVETPLKEAVGKVCNEFIYAYPPDIPVLTPGEIIREKTLEYLLNLYHSGVSIISDSANFPNRILTKTV